MYRLILFICPVISLICAASLYPYALGMDVNAMFIAELFVGGVLIVVGNYLPKCRQNYTVGIKLPWTIHDEENWNRTHRMAGWLWMAGGLVILLNTFLGIVREWLPVVIFAIIVLVPVGYSFGYYMKHREDK